MEPGLLGADPGAEGFKLAGGVAEGFGRCGLPVFTGDDTARDARLGWLALPLGGEARARAKQVEQYAGDAGEQP